MTIPYLFKERITSISKQTEDPLTFLQPIPLLQFTNLAVVLLMECNGILKLCLQYLIGLKILFITQQTIKNIDLNTFLYKVIINSVKNAFQRLNHEFLWYKTFLGDFMQHLSSLYPQCDGYLAPSGELEQSIVCCPRL